ncbi:MAG: anaerobic C4-dicarboxylate transporter family protein [Sutterellaceae bacterium]|nr:anaerobic C4-dicarboxylate transporter family protein [Sutterellaceae bacterium]MDD7441387.1 anaerobic C4-dicarboxylate transporter family protein [Sutterellaceae bacterium]MDY2867490.1 anaerobic C4-dicarboxylate transporter family protein [Mesosutterella sp.]
METDLNFWLELLTVAFCIGLGGRFGGVGLGAAGGLGVSILVLLFGLKPSSPPVSTILIIVAVIACTSILQGAGGLDWMVKIAERMLRKWPKAITFVAPFVCSFFVIFVGTAYVAFAVYPVVAEVATQAKVRPERPIAASVISAGIAVVASPMSAATAAMVAALSPVDVSLFQILLISVPAFLIATLATCLSVYWRGTELEDDPEFKRRVAAGEFKDLYKLNKNEKKEQKTDRRVLLSVAIFALGVAMVLIFGSFKELLPTWEAAGKVSRLPIPSLIQMIMLACGLFIIVACKVPSSKFADGSVFRAGLIGVVGVFGVSWLTGTFFDAYHDEFVQLFKMMAESTPLLFGLVLFLFSAVILSPSATVVALMPLGLAIGIPPLLLVALYPCTCGDYLIPGGAQIGCCSFDRTGTTHLGSWVLNHSYLLPGCVHVVTGTAVGYLIYALIG